MRLHRVLCVRDGRKHLARRELLLVDVQLFQNVLDDALGVIRVVDRKVARKAEAVDIAAQDAHAGGVERHRPHALRTLNAKSGQAFAQLVCRLVRECHRQHRPRRGGLKRAEVYHAAALIACRMLGVIFQKCKVVLRRPRRHVRAVAPPPVGQNIRHTVDEHRRLAAARARKQQQRPLGRQHAAALFRVEFCKIPRNGRFSRSGIAGDKIAHIVFTFPDLSISYPFFVLRSTPFDKNRLFVRFFVDKDVCSIYNHTRTKILFVRRNFPWLLPHLFSFSSASASSPPR